MLALDGRAQDTGLRVLCEALLIDANVVECVELVDVPDDPDEAAPA